MACQSARQRGYSDHNIFLVAVDIDVAGEFKTKLSSLTLERVIEVMQKVEMDREE